MSSEWLFYILGAVLTLAWKMCRYAWIGTRNGKGLVPSLAEWFFEPSAENAVSWISTVGAVWLLGSIYIDHVILVTGLTDLPVLDSLAFLLGSLMEFTAPSVAKWLLSKVPGA